MNLSYTEAKFDNIFTNTHSISTDTILAIQNDLEPYDMISLVFLLYDTPDTALQRLTVYERIYTDVSGENMNLLYDWAMHAQTRATWKYEFLEALSICRLYGIIRKLGYNVSKVKKRYYPENTCVNFYINPIKKVLYKLCENITHDDFQKLKNTLLTYDLKFPDHQTCELLLLELMCQKFIKVPIYDKQKCVYTQAPNLQKFAQIIEYFSALRQYSVLLHDIENQLNNTNNVGDRIYTQSDKLKSETSINKSNSHESDLHEIFQELNQLCLDKNAIKNFKSDTRLLHDAYPIKNKMRIGLCCIINQEYFHLSRRNIELGIAQQNLENRHGSSRDLSALETTMASLNFKVISKSNLDHTETILFIKDVIKHHVLPDDSVFMLCILSHGVRGNIFAADSVKIKVQDIQNILDEAVTLHDMPKVMILQACQGEEEKTQNIALVADSPNSGFYLKKSHFLVYWATAPEYEAFRHELGGTLFIQLLCDWLKKKGKTEQLSDIFTKVTDNVTMICTRLQKGQVPLFESTLRKKLYLYHSELA